MNIEWKNNAVCYADGKQWRSRDNDDEWVVYEGYESRQLRNIASLINEPDFQLNIPREGDYLRKEELDSEGKYNDAVEVFGLFGHHFGEGATKDYESIETYGNLTICYDGVFTTAREKVWCKRELTYNQLMTIGNIKRLLNSKSGDTVCGQPKEDFVKAIERVNELESEGKNIKRNKSKQAYDILQSLDYEYDLVEQRWYRKDWV